MLTTGFAATSNIPIPVIPQIDQAIATALADKINNKTKPLGSLGMLEQLALKIGIIQNTLSPKLNQPVMLVFAGDHGIVESGVSPYPQAVTQQMVLNFLGGGAAINVFAKQNGMEVRVIDAGVNHQFAANHELIDAKVGMGTRNFLLEPAMTMAECEQALSRGVRIAQHEISAGSNVLGFGEMGIGNTSSAALLMSVLCGEPIGNCVGRGTGLDDDGLQKKTDILSQALLHHNLGNNTDNSSSNIDALQVLATFGGFEIAMMTGAMLGAAEKKAVLLIDGFIASAALLVAATLQPTILQYCIFSHRSNESGHRKLLELLNAHPLLQLDMRLGEGTGAALAYPLVQAAVNFLNEMASFESASVSRKAG